MNLHELIKENIDNIIFRDKFIDYILQSEDWLEDHIGYVAGRKFKVINSKQDPLKSVTIQFLNTNKILSTEPYFISKNYDEYTDDELNIIFNKLNYDYHNKLNKAIYRFLVKTKLSKEQIFKFKNQLNWNYIISDYPEYKNDFIKLLLELINKIPVDKYFKEKAQSNKRISAKFIALNYTDYELLEYMLNGFLSYKNNVDCNTILKIFDYLPKSEIIYMLRKNELNDIIIKKILNKLSIFDNKEKIEIIDKIKICQWDNISDTIKNQILILEKFNAF